MSEIEMTRRVRQTDFCYVEPALKQYYASKQRCLSWQRKGDDTLSLRFGQGIYPVNIQELQKHAPEVYKLVKKSSISLTPEGYLQRSDAVLCHQAESEREEWEEAFRQRTYEQEESREAIEALGDEVNRLVRSTGHSKGDVLTGRIPTASEVAHVSKKLNAPGVQIGVTNKE